MSGWTVLRAASLRGPQNTVAILYQPYRCFQRICPKKNTNKALHISHSASLKTSTFLVSPPASFSHPLVQQRNTLWKGGRNVRHLRVTACAASKDPKHEVYYPHKREASPPSALPSSAAEGAAPGAEEQDPLSHLPAEQAGISQDPDSPVETPTLCAGCGVSMQTEDPDMPGYYVMPKRLLEPEVVEEEEVEEEDAGDQEEGPEGKKEEEEGQEGEDERVAVALEAFDNALEEWFGDELKEADPDFSEKWRAPSEARPELPPPPLVCMRCYSLRHYGKVKKIAAESLMPAFDFQQEVGEKIKASKNRVVVIVAVDLADFDGSFPRSIMRTLRDHPRAQVILALTKVDLVPRVASAERLEKWVRGRAKSGGLAQPAAVHLVSNKNGSGIQPLLATLERMCGRKGDVWVVGAQNAGKSSLINALAGHKGGHLASARAPLTAAPLPGTTIGCVELPKLLPEPHRAFDTPGILQPHQLTTRLHADELKMVLPLRQLRPRTFRVPEGATIHIGALARVDVIHLPARTMYLTVWASADIVCHFGKMERAEELYDSHAGGNLQPPIGDKERLAKLGEWVPYEVVVEGKSYKRSQSDVAISGLGWVAASVDGQAQLQVWTYSGIAVTTRDALMPDHAKEWERPGWGEVLSANIKKGKQKKSSKKKSNRR